MGDYIDSRLVTAIRIFWEDNCWAVDGTDGHGNCTESCWTYDTLAEAQAEVSEFRDGLGIAEDVPVVLVPKRRFRPA